ncbi:DUF5665 domain-containing protein [Salipaludibacillus neizhouensis]|uniref:DUF5665 domain-containing protein n=1 Tax=Salipaludibacillus neizhouensis TaxID=885475 RepID=UPI00217EC3F4|nr:DUF5665 domain-containing protein [Salipaludibacillus neizhouensis]
MYSLPLTTDQKNRKIPPKNRGGRNPEDEKKQDENERFEKLLYKFEDITTNGRLKDMAYHFTNKKEVIKVNLIAGVARGVGLTLGTAIFLGIFFLILANTVSLPLVGDYIASFLDMIESYRNQ